MESQYIPPMEYRAVQVIYSIAFIASVPQDGTHNSPALDFILTTAVDIGSGLQ